MTYYAIYHITIDLEQVTDAARSAAARPSLRLEGLKVPAKRVILYYVN